MHTFQSIIDVATEWLGTWAIILDLISVTKIKEQWGSSQKSKTRHLLFGSFNKKLIWGLFLYDFDCWLKKEQSVQENMMTVYSDG